MKPADVSHKKRQLGAGKRQKTFVDDKDIALGLAHTIVDEQEHKSKEKVEKYHSRAQVTATPAEHKHRTSTKDKLRDVTAALRAEKARAKRDKAKTRKQAQKEITVGRDITKSDSKTAASKPTLRKRVAFA